MNMPSPHGESSNLKPRDSQRKVKDPIHDLIPLSSNASAIVDTKQFQRLRHIKQLGTTYHVWPGASHNRFEHCLGVGHLARSMVEHLQQSQPELSITARDIQCVEFAGLCHDLGHGPWSHVWDGQVMPRAKPRCSWQHELGSVMMFDDMVIQNNFETWIPAEDVAFIKALILGDPDKCMQKEKLFLFDIVSNKRNGLDVDKFEYIARDSHMVGDPMKINIGRILQSARVINNQICYDIKDVNQIHEICYTRFKLHKMIYNHKTAKAIEYMIVDAILLADPYLKLSDRMNNPLLYLHLNDSIMLQIEATEIPGSQYHEELAPSRAVFERIRNRDLYRVVDHKVIPWNLRGTFEKYITCEAIVEAAKAGEGPDSPAMSLEVDDIIVDMSPMHYGMKDKNPLDFVRWYSKTNPDICAKAQEGDYSMLMPAVFGEVLLRVYTKDSQFFGFIQAGYRSALESMPTDSDSSAPKSVVPPADALVTPSPSPGVPVSLKSQNSFTTVEKTHVLTSPGDKYRTSRPVRSISRSHKRRTERGHDLDERDESPSPKRRRAVI